MDKRLFPATSAFFEREIQPLIEGSSVWKGRPPRISHYEVFCALLGSGPISSDQAQEDLTIHKL